MNFFNFFYVFEHFLTILKTERNVTKFEYVVVTRFHIKHNNFLAGGTNSCTVIALIFFKNVLLKNINRFKQIHMNSEKSINSFEIKKKIGCLIVYATIIFFTNLLLTFRDYYYVK